MSRRLTGLVLLVAISSSLMGCTSSGLFGSKGKIKGQWEPEIEETDTKAADWRSAPSELRKGKAKESQEDPIDKLIWSDTSREINRNLGGAL